MDGAVFPPCSLPRPNWVGIMATSTKRMYASMLPLPGLLQSVCLTPRQPTVNPRLCWRFPNTHRQVWLSLLWGHCSFLLGLSVHKVLLVSSKSLFPQSCGSSVMKCHWPFKSQIPWGFSVLLLDAQVGNFLWGL